MPVFKMIRVPRPDRLDPARIDEYHAFLLNTVYPAIDDLQSERLIQGYDFLSHGGLELRLWLPDPPELRAVKATLEKYGLPTELQSGDPAETGTDREALLRELNQGAELIRLIVQQTAKEAALSQLVHYLLNQYGFGNLKEAEWHDFQAKIWRSVAIQGST